MEMLMQRSCAHRKVRHQGQRLLLLEKVRAKHSAFYSTESEIPTVFRL